MSSPFKPLIFARFYLDAGTQRMAGKTVTNFQGEDFVARVVGWASIDESISDPPGNIEIGDCTIELFDGDGTIKTWFNTTTPIRRLVDITFDFEENAGLPPATAQPLFTGTVDADGTHFPLGKAVIKLRNIINTWLDQEIPGLITRDNFPNLPSDVEWDFAPIIFGQVDSYLPTGYLPQGVIRCPHVDTTLNTYAVARHTVGSVDQVYRKRPQEQTFKVVAASEYEIITGDVTVPPTGGITYTFTYIHFYVAQYSRTVIHADVTGIDRYWDFDTEGWVTGAVSRNPVLLLHVLIFFLTQDELNINRFDVPSFQTTIDRCDAKTYFCDGAITAESNARRGITRRVAISRLCGDFLIDFFQNSSGQIKVWMYDEELDSPFIADLNNIQRMTFDALMPKEVFNRARYRYAHQNAQLIEYIKSSASGQWGFEDTIDNMADQEELGATGENPLLEEVVELYFVRDDHVAMNVTKRRMYYWTLRSYDGTFDLPLPLDFANAALSKPVQISHYGGPAAGGWTNEICRCSGLTWNLKSWMMTVRFKKVNHISDADLKFSFTGSHPLPDPQAYHPEYPVTVNGDVTPEPTDVSPTVNLTTETDPTMMLAGYEPVVFSAKRYATGVPLEPRQVYAWARKSSGIIIGTLSPDEKPTTLTDADIGVLFYATDFDNFYMWRGADAEPPWECVNCQIGNIVFRMSIPGVGYAICDGSDVTSSFRDGSVGTITTPDMIGAYPKGAGSYDPDQKPAVIPGNTVTVTDFGHTHSIAAESVSGTSGAGSAHSHSDTLVITDAGHTHSFSSGSMTTSSSGAHDHTGETANDGSHVHTSASGPSDSGGIDITVNAHHHTITGATAATDVDSHVHSLSGVSGAGLEGTSTPDYGFGLLYTDGDGDPALFSVDPISISGDLSGDTDGTSGTSHTHAFVGGQATQNADGSAHIDQDAINITVGSTGSDHQHAISSDGAHTHTGTASGTTGSGSASIISSLSILSESAHTHSISLSTAGGNTGNSITSISVSVADDDTAEPPHNLLLPYIKL